MATSTIQHRQATEPLTKPPIAATAQPPSIRAGGGGDSSIAPHPDAPKTKSESNCIVRCFVGIKNQIVRFFDWVCSLFRSGSKKLTEEEKKAIEKNKQLALEEAGLKKKLAQSDLPEEERQILQDMLLSIEAERGLYKIEELLKERDKGPVSAEEGLGPVLVANRKAVSSLKHALEELGPALANNRKAIYDYMVALKMWHN